MLRDTLHERTQPFNSQLLDTLVLCRRNPLKAACEGVRNFDDQVRHCIRSLSYCATTATRRSSRRGEGASMKPRGPNEQKEIIVQELESVPEKDFAALALLAESSLMKDWLSPEEEAAWADL